MSASIGISYSDIINPVDYPGMAVGFVADAPIRVFDLSSHIVRKLGCDELGNSLDNASCALCFGYAALDGYLMVKSAIACVKIVFGSKGSFLGEGINFLRNGAATFVDIGYALKLPGISSAISDKIAPFLPWFDTLTHVIDGYDNAATAFQALKVKKEYEEAYKIKKLQSRCEFIKHAVLGVGALTAGAGVVLSSWVLFAISVTAFITAMIASFAKNQLTDYVVKNRLTLN
ncbi:MAG: hypothetical protein FJZ59_00495 [Chlamydiae bacterium]|jgi:hypothetical protein|nr:hypothetical protein [Chlamydiota bacterium]